MNDCISREEALKHSYIVYDDELERHNVVSVEDIEELPSAQPDARLKKIADLVDGTIDHFDRDDAMDLLYQIKEVLKNE